VVDVAARDLLSTSPGGRYDYFSGSSMGAARVTGLSALLRQEGGHLSSAEMLDDLDQRLAALDARAAESRLVTHAYGTAGNALAPQLDRQRTAPVLRTEGT
jgi:hypothetical protein